MRAVVILAFLLFIPSIGFSATFYVPDNYPTIQDAINAAVDGDTVIVRPGTYVENIDFVGKAITVKSQSGPEATVIDGNQSGSVATFQSGELQDSALNGFTLTNGNADKGGGICCGRDSSPTITNNTITENTASSGSYGTGGGISCDWKSSPKIINNTISGNTASDDGGGIDCWSCSPSITNNTISGNTASWNGGGINCSGSSSSPSITNNTISGNTASDDGGGIFCSGSSSSPTITNNTISWNTADDGGGGIFCYDGCSPTITNTILWDNSATEGPEINLYWSYSGPCNLAISYSDVEGGQSSCYVHPNCTLNWGAGMIDADPLFLDTANGDFHIPFDSPCRSAGDRNAPNLPDTDFEGDPRTGLFAFPDIGADEFHTHFYVNGTVSQGSNATGVIIGWPKTNPVMLISGSGILPTPDPTPFGDFWLMPPWNHRIHFNAMPDNGVRLIDRVVSTGLPPGTQIPFQALVGTELSNLYVVEIE